jgi:hypothetical protein
MASGLPCGGNQLVDLVLGEVLATARYPVWLPAGWNFPIYGVWDLAAATWQVNDLAHGNSPDIRDKGH